MERTAVEVELPEETGACDTTEEEDEKAVVEDFPVVEEACPVEEILAEETCSVEEALVEDEKAEEEAEAEAEAEEEAEEELSLIHI